MRIPTPRLRHIIRIASLLGLAAALCLALAFWILRQNATGIAGHYLERIGNSAGITLSVGAVGVTFLPCPALTLADLHVEGPTFRCDTAIATLCPRILPLLAARFEPRRIILERPRLLARIDSSGHAPVEVPDVRQLLRPLADGMNRHLPAGSQIGVRQGVLDIALGESDQDGRLLLQGTGLELQSLGLGRVSGQFAAATMRWNSDGKAVVDLDNVRFDWQADLREPLLGQGFFYLHADLAAPGLGQWPGARLGVQTGAQGWDIQLHLDGHLDLSGEQAPMSLGARVRVPADGSEVSVRDGAWQLDADSGDFAFSARLPHAARRLLARIRGLPSPADEAGWQVAGNLGFHRLSLTQWLGFGRLLNPGLQQTLDNITDGRVSFIIDAQGLQAPEIEASCTRARFRGSGSVESWREPVVALEVSTDRANLLLAIPEAGGAGALAPNYFFAPLTPVPDQPWHQGETLIGYDIRIGARRVDYGPVHFDDASVRIVPGKLDSTGQRPVVISASGALYGGRTAGKCVLGTARELPYAITGSAEGVDAAALSGDLDLVPVKAGRLSARLDIKSQGRTLNVFLDKLSGSVKVRGESGEVRVPGQKKGLPFSVLEGGLVLRRGSFKNSRLFLDGKWSLDLKGGDYGLSLGESGALQFGGEDMLAFQNLPAEISFRILPRLSGLAKTVSGRGRCSLSLGPRMKLHMQKASIELMGSVVEGDVAVRPKNGFVEAAGSARLRCADLPAALAIFGVQSGSVPTALSPLELGGNFRAAPDGADLDDMRFQLGKTGGEGTLGLKYGAGRPKFDFDLRLDSLDLEPYLQGRGPGRAALNFDFMREFDADGHVEIKNFSAFGLRASRVRLPVTLREGKCAMTPVEALFYGANLHAELRLVFGRGVRFENRLLVRKFNLGQLSRDLKSSVALGGMATLEGSTSGTVTARGQLPGAIFGSWSFSAQDGSYQTLINGRPKGEPTKFRLARASGALERSVLSSNDFLMRGDGMEITGGGWFNLDKKTLDCNFNINMKGLPDIPMRLHGSLADCKTSIGAGQLILNTIGGVASGFVDVLGGVARGAIGLFR